MRVNEGFAEAERNDDSLKLYQIIEAEASGQGAQSIAVSVSELLNLKMKGDFFLYLKEFRRIADVLKKQEPDPAKLLEAILDGKFVIGLEYPMFPQLNEMFGKRQWPGREDLAGELGRYLTTTDRIHGLLDPDQQQQHQRQQVSANWTRQRGSNEDICFNCNQAGHRSMDCPKQPNKCKDCGRWGHLPKYCRKKGGGKKPPSSDSDEDDSGATVVTQASEKKKGDRKSGKLAANYTTAGGRNRGFHEAMDHAIRTDNLSYFSDDDDEEEAYAY